MSEMVRRLESVIVDGLDNNEFAIDIARSALEAMREPTGAMTDAVFGTTARSEAEEVWEAMIAAALGDPKHD